MTGQITVGAYAAKNLVVMARSSANRTFVGSVSATGAFKVTVPTGASYRLTLADRGATGSFTAVSRIAWPIAARARWAKINSGSTVQFGSVHPQGAPTTSTSSIKTSSDGTGDTGGGDTAGGDTGGANDQSGDVTQCGSQTEETGDNNTEQTDNCEDDNAAVCEASDETDSEGDAQDQSGVQSDDGTQHESSNETDSACTPTTPPAGGANG